MSSVPAPPRTALAALLLASLTACGGGGSTAAPSTATSPAAASPAPASPTVSSPAAPSPAATSPTASATASASASASPSTSASAAAATITIADFEYEMPRKVAPGAVVRITNEDEELHTFTSRQAGLDVQVPIGKTVQFRAPSKAGTYQVVCTLHAGMDTTLVVG